jgi:NAD(P)-dependent dehydrogenase (short-subunit alcohol dehydrogenase family)
VPRATPVALVTGGANGIGRAISLHLLTEGWRVGIVDLQGSGLRHFFRGKRNTLLVEGDAREQETAARTVATIVGRFGRLDGLVSNAGIMIRKPLRQITLDEWHRVIDTNLTATFLFAQAAEKELRKARGSIVTIASTRARMSEPDTESYAASKGGLVALTHALAVSLGPQVRVNCVSPGWIETKNYAALHRGDHAQHPGRPRRQTVRHCRTCRVAARRRAIRLRHRRRVRG